MSKNSIKNSRLLSLGMVLSVVFGSSSVAAGNLSGQEVRQLISGNTVEAVHPHKGYSLTTYFLPDGTFRQKRDGEAASGTWHIDSEGQLCTHRTGWGGECRLIVKDGDVWKAYKIPDNPMKSPKHKRTFNKVLEGNPHGL